MAAKIRKNCRQVEPPGPCIRQSSMFDSNLPHSAERKPARLFLSLLGLALAMLALVGCGMFNASAQVGPDLKPRVGAGVSIPFGK
jgi:hypothetical protein